MRLKLIFFILIISVVVSAQDYNAQYVIGDDANYYMHPVWSPDGSKIAFSGSNYNGIWIINSDGSDLVQITDEAAAGWGFEWSTDSKSILSRVAKFENRRRYNAVKIFDIESSTSSYLTEYKTFMPSLPHWVNNDQDVLLMIKNKAEKFESGKINSENISLNYPKYSCFLNGNKITIYNNSTGEYRSIAPLDNVGYLNPVISRDGQRIAFEEYGGNLFVINTDGSNLIDLGTGFTPDWSPDGKKLVYTISEDDGHQFTASDIFIIDMENLDKTNLTNSSDKLEMHPDWSPDGNSIIFDESNSGHIYKIDL